MRDINVFWKEHILILLFVRFLRLDSMMTLWPKCSYQLVACPQHIGTHSAHRTRYPWPYTANKTCGEPVPRVFLAPNDPFYYVVHGKPGCDSGRAAPTASGSSFSLPRPLSQVITWWIHGASPMTPTGNPSSLPLLVDGPPSHTEKLARQMSPQPGTQPAPP